MTRDELLAELLVERYDNRWWKTPPPEFIDDDVTTARRRKALADEWGQANEREGAA